MTSPLAPATLFDLSGEVALVTGASRGLGLAMARALAGAGAHVALNARDADALDRRVAEFRRAGLSAEALAFDVADAAASEAAVADLGRRHGRLSILVGNAAATSRKPLLEQEEEDWARVIAVDLTACWRLARAAARLMIPANHGRIVFTSSINATIARPGITPYVTAKTGLHGLVRALAVELAPAGITVNAIAPGYFLTEGNAALRASDPGFEARIAARTPAGRWGRPEELATAALFLCARASAYCNGSVVTVDGAMTGAI